MSSRILHVAYRLTSAIAVVVVTGVEGPGSVSLGQVVEIMWGVESPAMVVRARHHVGDFFEVRSNAWRSVSRGKTGGCRDLKVALLQAFGIILQRYYPFSHSVHRSAPRTEQGSFRFHSAPLSEEIRGRPRYGRGRKGKT